jgi:DNA-binding CsgD family transcriptional regulator
MLKAEPRSTPDHSLDEFLRVNDFGHVLGAVLDGGKAARTVIAVHRSHRLGPYSADHHESCELLLPHLRAAVALTLAAVAARAHAARLEGVLDRLPMAVFLVDQNLQVRLCNRVGRRLVAARRGLIVRDGRLRALDTSENARLEQIVRRPRAPRAAGNMREAAISLMRSDVSHPLHVMSLPLPVATGGLRAWDVPVVALLVGDPEQEFRASEAVIGTLYHLTIAEARLVGALLTGMRVRELAESLGISEQTVRTQLKRVLQKTGAGRQSELVRIVLTGPSFFTCEVDDADAP